MVTERVTNFFGDYLFYRTKKKLSGVCEQSCDGRNQAMSLGVANL